MEEEGQGQRSGDSLRSREAERERETWKRERKSRISISQKRKRTIKRKRMKKRRKILRISDTKWMGNWDGTFSNTKRLPMTSRERGKVVRTHPGMKERGGQ